LFFFVFFKIFILYFYSKDNLNINENAFNDNIEQNINSNKMKMITINIYDLPIFNKFFITIKLIIKYIYIIVIIIINRK